MLSQFRDVLKSLNSRKVKYVVIGGAAAIHHGVPRVTFDLDILIEPDIDNAARLLDGLKENRFGTAHMTTPERVATASITQFVDWLALDVFTRPKGLTFATAWKNREFIRLDGIRIPVVCRRDLVRAKKAAARSQDLSDVELLEEVIRRERRGE